MLSAPLVSQLSLIFIKYFKFPNRNRLCCSFSLVIFNKIILEKKLSFHRDFFVCCTKSKLSYTMPEECLLRSTPDNPLKIGTHDGTFHCDEALGCYLLKILHPNARIVRSRDEEVLKNCDIVIDVGGIFDPAKLRFDHHQREFEETFGSFFGNKKKWTVKLSSAGLVYCHFGKDILKEILKDEVDETVIDKLFVRIYEQFIQEVDGVDNGVPMFKGEPLYRITTGLSSRVQVLNKPWNGPDSFSEKEAFERAMELTGSEFMSRVISAARIWWPARSIVLNAINNRFKVNETGEILELEQFCPWKEHFFELEAEMSILPVVKYVIFSSGSNWRVQAVSLNSGSFLCRLFLPNEWRGLVNEELSEKAGIEGCIFVHSTGFIGGNKTRAGALAMASKALEIGKKEKQT